MNREEVIPFLMDMERSKMKRSLVLRICVGCIVLGIMGGWVLNVDVMKPMMIQSSFLSKLCPKNAHHCPAQSWWLDMSYWIATNALFLVGFILAAVCYDFRRRDFLCLSPCLFVIGCCVVAAVGAIHRSPIVDLVLITTGLFLTGLSGLLVIISMLTLVDDIDMLFPGRQIVVTPGFLCVATGASWKLSYFVAELLSLVPGIGLPLILVVTGIATSILMLMFVVWFEYTPVNLHIKKGPEVSGDLLAFSSWCLYAGVFITTAAIRFSYELHPQSRLEEWTTPPLVWLISVAILGLVLSHAWKSWLTAMCLCITATFLGHITNLVFQFLTRVILDLWSITTFASVVIFTREMYSVSTYRAVYCATFGFASFGNFLGLVLTRIWLGHHDLVAACMSGGSAVVLIPVLLLTLGFKRGYDGIL